MPKMKYIGGRHNPIMLRYICEAKDIYCNYKDTNNNTTLPGTTTHNHRNLDNLFSVATAGSPYPSREYKMNLFTFVLFHFLLLQPPLIDLPLLPYSSSSISSTYFVFVLSYFSSVFLLLISYYPPPAFPLMLSHLLPTLVVPPFSYVFPLPNPPPFFSPITPSPSILLLQLHRPLLMLQISSPLNSSSFPLVLSDLTCFLLLPHSFSFLSLISPSSSLCSSSS